MNKTYLVLLFTLVIVIALFLETTIVAVPLTYLIGSFFLIFVRKVKIYILVFLMAFIIDSLRVSNFGVTGIFFIGLFAIIFVYEKYSGSKDVLISSFLIAVSSIFYAHLLSYSLGMTFGTILSLGTIWYVINKIQQRERSVI